MQKGQTKNSHDSHDKKGSFDYFIGYRNETNTFSSTIIQKTSPNECIC